jgi:hypothetical protein
MKQIWERIRGRRRQYRRLFLDGEGQLTPAAAAVLADLKRFCRAETSTVVVSPVSKAVDPLAMAMAEGRREVWNRIQQHLHLPEREISQLKENDE